MDLKESHLLADASQHWYYRAKTEAIVRLLRPFSITEILDVGAGSGLFSRALLRRSTAGRAVCVDPGYTIDSEVDEGGKPLLFRRHVDHSSADLVLMMDVLEHVPDDGGFVADYAMRVRSGTRFLITVPAFNWLWSGHDVSLQHFRRYTLDRVEATVRMAGLAVTLGCYYYAAVLPAAVVSRKVVGLIWPRTTPRSQMSDLPRPLSAILSAVCRAELPMMRHNRLGGLSACVVAIKP